MGFLYLFIARLSAVIKMLAVKKCGNINTGARESVKINLIRSSGSLAISILVCLFSGFQKMSGYGVLFTVISGITSGIMLWAWLLASACAPMITVEVFCMVGGVVIPLIISPIVISGTSVTLIQWIGSLLLFVAMFCLSKRGGGKKITPKSILYMCLAGLANAGYVISQKFYMDFSCGTTADFQLGTFLFTIVTLAAMLLFMQIFTKPQINEQPARITPKIMFFIALAFTLTYVTQFFTTEASGMMDAAIFYPFSYIIFMPMVFLVDVIIFKEKVTVNNIIGIILVTVSGILVNL